MCGCVHFCKQTCIGKRQDPRVNVSDEYFVPVQTYLAVEKQVHLMILVVSERLDRLCSTES